MTTWEKLWKDPAVVARWKDAQPLPEVVAMADRLVADGGGRVLDIGCGLGRHTVYLAARGLEVVATDSAPAAVAACKSNLAEAGLRAEVMRVDMSQYPFPDAHFRGVVASHVIHHTDLATLKRILADIWRVLAPGGYFVWATPCPKHYECGSGTEIEPGTWVDPEGREAGLPHHYCTEAEVRGLLSGFDILSMNEHEYREGENSRWHFRILARKRADQ